MLYNSMLICRTVRTQILFTYSQYENIQEESVFYNRQIVNATARRAFQLSLKVSIKNVRIGSPTPLVRSLVPTAVLSEYLSCKSGWEKLVVIALNCMLPSSCFPVNLKLFCTQWCSYNVRDTNLNRYEYDSWILTCMMI